MNNDLLKLVSIASDQILSPPHASELAKLQPAGAHATALWELLNLKNGFYAFESALHVFPIGSKESVMDLESWNSDNSWRNEYAELARDCFFFAEDVFGQQFCFKKGAIHTFDPETGSTQHFAEGLDPWASLILENYNLHTGYSLAHEWQAARGALKPGFRLVPKTPFVLGGEFSIQNLHALDSAKAMRFRASIAVQIKDLPDGAEVKLRVLE